MKVPRASRVIRVIQVATQSWFYLTADRVASVAERAAGWSILSRYFINIIQEVARQNEGGNEHVDCAKRKNVESTTLRAGEE